MSNPTQNPLVDMFEERERAANYADAPPKFVPGFADVHRMVTLLLEERVSEHASILVHGAGGGLELDAFARANPGWTFTGVDPAKAMIDEARGRLEHARDRVEFHVGFIDDAPLGPFDAATSLMTLHFLAPDARCETVRQIVDRMEPGAPFIAMHCSFPQSEPDREAWLARYKAFAIAKGAPPEMAQAAREGMTNSLPILDVQQDVRLLREAGLRNVTSFYSAFTWQGWVGYAP